jgi:hypothetical protein
MKPLKTILAVTAVLSACDSGQLSGASPPLTQPVAQPVVAAPTNAAPVTPPSGFQPTAPVIVPQAAALPELVVTPTVDAEQSDASRPPGHVSGEQRRDGAGRHKDAPAVTPIPQGPAVSKAEAETILKPKILACMKQENVYFLQVDVGQGYGKHKPEVMPPLIIVDESDVNYKPVARLEKTALGKCILAAAAPIRTSAFGGNYMGFGLINESAPDPLAGAEKNLNWEEAKKVLSALDGEARQCRQKFPIAEWEGRTIDLDVQFWGADGSLKRVDPGYIDSRSAFSKCLTALYKKKASISRFRSEWGSFRYDLKP